MKARNHFHFTRGNIQQTAPMETVYNIPNQPIEAEPIRHREPIKMEKFQMEKKKKSKFQRE